jgi:hypothetical protein
MNGVRRGKGARTTVPAKDGRRAGICWTVTSPLVQPATPARVLGWLTPVEYEQDHYAALSREPQPA